MIELVVVFLVAAGLAYYVVRPLLRGPRREPDDDAVSAPRAEERKRAALTAIVDIEDELAVGKLTREDFKALSNQYEEEAISALRELDARWPAADLDDALEREIAALRAQLACPTCGGVRTAEGVCPRCQPTKQ
jgi:hypothetical protein